MIPKSGNSLSEKIVLKWKIQSARRPKEPKMSTSTSRASATIYTFPPRGRYAIHEQDMSTLAATLPRGAVLSSGSGWYHEEAIQAAREAELGRKN
jgi:hypothetical protein